MNLSHNHIQSFLDGLTLDSSGIYVTGAEGYWSNLSKSENSEFLKRIDIDGAEEAVKQVLPHLYDMIYDPTRESALDLLSNRDAATCIDFGCMWGVLSVGASKRFKNVLAIDQTYESLYFLRKRCQEEGIDNIYCIQGDIKNIANHCLAEFAIVNGVLEWIPVVESVVVSELSKARYNMHRDLSNPRNMQLDFLKRVYASLAVDGELVMAIENRHSYQYYMGMRDPHSNLLFTTFLPRFIANWISLLFRKKKYRNYIYSFKELAKLLEQAGFQEVRLHAAFPNYHFPKLILPYSSDGISGYRGYENKLRITKKQKIAYFVEKILMGIFKARWFSPAIIAIAVKRNQ